MGVLFRTTRCAFSNECRNRQILRGLGVIGTATLILTAHLQQVGKLPQTIFFNPPSAVISTTQTISAYTPQTVPAVSALPSQTVKAAPPLPAHWSLEKISANGAFDRSAQTAGLTKAETHTLTQIFADKIDFRHLHRGDRVNVITERIPATKPHQANADNIIGAEIISGKQTTIAIRYADNKGNITYYQPDGSSLVSGFLRYPAHYTRIGSGFMLHRLDPVTGEYHSHPAIDFDAPMGTPITATADGKITTINFEQGYGNVVKIHHPGDVTTLYAHMRNFAKGLHTNSAVKKGQVIGYVGMSGYATGPHVHYELHYGAKPVNPLTAKLPTASSIPLSQRLNFDRSEKQVVRWLNA